MKPKTCPQCNSHLMLVTVMRSDGRFMGHAVNCSDAACDYEVKLPTSNLDELLPFFETA